MKLIIKRSQDTGFFGGISFVLEAKVVLEPQEEKLDFLAEARVGRSL